METDYDAPFQPNMQAHGASYRLARVLFDGWTEGQIRDLSEHGANAGWPGLTYTSDMVEFYAEHSDDLWELAADHADDMGETVPQIMARREVSSHGDLVTFLCWFAAESLASEVVADIDGDR